MFNKELNLDLKKGHKQVKRRLTNLTLYGRLENEDSALDYYLWSTG